MSLILHNLAFDPVLWEITPGTVGMAAAVTLAFTGLALWLEGVSRSGALAGAVVCFVLYASAGPGAFAALASVFLLTWLATRLGYSRKQMLGAAERQGGRKASQVLANLGVATLSCAFYAATRGNTIFLIAASAALSEAAADTVSSELGQAHNTTARLITTWAEVPAGTDGGVTLTGTLAGAISAAIVSAICGALRLLPWRWVGVSIVAAVVGMIVDSYLGAILERRRWLNNDSVNFLSTLAAAASAAIWLQFAG